jgi:hypothetical protein
MTQEEKDKMLEKLNKMLEKSDKAISIYNRLLDNKSCPEEHCLKQIDMINQKKKAIIEMIKKYE